MIEPVCGSEFITLLPECQGLENGLENALSGEVCVIEPTSKRHIAVGVADPVRVLFLDSRFQQRRSLPAK